MAIETKDIELFKNGKDFSQIQFLDNFYENFFSQEKSEDDLSRLLSTAINDSNNIYVKRSAFKIFCELTLIQKITNQYSSLTHLQNFLFSKDNALQGIALKYLPHFPIAHLNDTQERLKLLSDSDNGEVASEAYLCLGFLHLTSSVSPNNASKLLPNLHQAKQYFQAANAFVQNRVDAQFYIILIEWIESVFTNDLASIKLKFNELQKNLQIRSLYEFEECGLELDFMIFQLTEQIKSSFDISSTSKEWLVVQPKIQLLMEISAEIGKIQKSNSSNYGLLKTLYNNGLRHIETVIYKTHLASEELRLKALKEQSVDTTLIEFIEKILSTFPDCTETRTEDLEQIAMLSQHLGKEKGLEVYDKIRNKEISLEKAVSELLRRNYNGQSLIRTGSIYGQEVLFSLTAQIEQCLPDYPANKKEAFFNIVEEVIRYTRSTLVGHEKKRFPFLFSKKEKIANKTGKGQDAIEQDLQDSMYSYLEHSKIADGLDHEKSKFVDGGRVDILYKKDLITVPIELKKSLIRPDENTLEQNYIAQAQTYTTGYDQLGIFVLLELSEKSKEVQPDFKDWFKIHHLPPSTNLTVNHPDYIISVVIPGNRTTPSTKSTYK